MKSYTSTEKWNKGIRFIFNRNNHKECVRFVYVMICAYNNTEMKSN